jgi:hypothetical protein
MKRLILSVTLFLMISPLANAKNVDLNGDAADSFIARHFPDADIPGPVKGVFTYVNKSGQPKKGYAECFVPAMGGRSNGEVSSCSVIY